MDDYSFYQAIMNTKPPEELVDVPEWGKSAERPNGMQVLCKALPAGPSVALQIKAHNAETKTNNYSEHFYEIVCAGCFNPETGSPAFKPEQEKLFMESGRVNGAPIQRLAMTVLTLSNLIGDTQKNA